MMLAIDIGNSNICLGVYEGKTPLFTARAKTDREREWERWERNQQEDAPLPEQTEEETPEIHS